MPKDGKHPIWSLGFAVVMVVLGVITIACFAEAFHEAYGR